MSRLSSGRTGMLVLGMAAFSLLMFVWGIYVGKTYAVEAQPLASEGGDGPSAEDVKPQLDFYQELMDDSRSGAQPAAQDEPAQPTQRGQAQSDPTPPAPSPPQPEPASSALPKIEVGYTVQVGAVKTRQDADQIIQQLRQKGYTGMVVDPDEGSDPFFRIWVGQFETRPEALRLDERLKADQFTTWVKKVRFP